MNMITQSVGASASLQSKRKALEKAKRVLAHLEEQAAGYTPLTLPPHIRIELEDQRNRVAKSEDELSLPIQLSAGSKPERQCALGAGRPKPYPKMDMSGLIPSQAEFPTLNDVQIKTSRDLYSEKVRVSISKVVRILVGGRYLLVKNRHTYEYQPVGGVLKRFPSSQPELCRLFVTDDEKYPIDDINRGDLRIMLPYSSIQEFITWLKTRRGRENSPHREFYEELILPGILPVEILSDASFDPVKVVVNWHQPYGCKYNELKIAEVCDLVSFTGKLYASLEKLQLQPDDRYIWTEEHLIAQRKQSPALEYSHKISVIAPWLL